MQTKVGVSPAYVLSQLAQAAAVTACFVASIAFINSTKTALFEPALTISETPFSWTSALVMDVEHGVQFPQSVQTPSLETLVKADVDAGLKKISWLEARAKQDRRKTWKHVAHLNIKPALQTDHVLTSEAAPVIHEEESETAKLQSVHMLLVKQFQLALDQAASEKVTTQVAETLNIHPAIMPVAAVPAESSDVIHVNAASEDLDGVPAKADRLGLAADRMIDKAAGLEDFPVPQESEGQAVRTISVQSQTQETQPPPVIAEAPPAPTVAAMQPPPTAEAKPELQQKLVTQVPVTVPPKSEVVTLNGSQIILPALPAEYSYSKPTAVDYPAPATSQLHPTTVVATQPKQPLAVPTSAPVLLAAATPPAHSLVSTNEPAPLISFIEAFDRGHEASDVQTEILTHEDTLGSSPSQKGWRIARSPDHWSSVYWNESGDVPVLSKNSAQLLSLKAGAAIQGDAGIVVAKVPAGWSLEFSGRSEHPLVFNESEQLLPNDSVNEDRMVVFLNASPGGQLLYLLRNGETGAATLPVFSGMLSYADLTHPEKKLINGKVLDASGKDARGLSGVQVQLVGSGQTAVTNSAGVFQFENVVSFGSQALFVEAQSAGGFPHRYRINPMAGRKLSFFFMTDEQVHDWIGQLDGGLSADSGLVVGALPGIVAANEEAELFPGVRSLALAPTLSPETYTLSGAGQLLVKAPLSDKNARLLGVQVPEGPAVVQLADKDGKVIWSELIVVSPRVLSVVGPL